VSEELWLPSYQHPAAPLEHLCLWSLMLAALATPSTELLVSLAAYRPLETLSPQGSHISSALLNFKSRAPLHSNALSDSSPSCPSPVIKDETTIIDMLTELPSSSTMSVTWDLSMVLIHGFSPGPPWTYKQVSPPSTPSIFVSKGMILGYSISTHIPTLAGRYFSTMGCQGTPGASRCQLWLHFNMKMTGCVCV